MLNRSSNFRALRILAAFSSAGLLFLLPSACSTDSGPKEQPAPGDPVLRAEILKTLGEESILPELKNFQKLAAKLEEAIQKLDSSPSDDTREVARNAFKMAMNSWQIIELMQMGPLATELRGGQELRAEVYSWPTTNTCRIDQLLTNDDFKEDVLVEKPLNSRGLDAIEYLLFNESPKNTCSDLVDINENGTWDALGEKELTTRRIAYTLSASTLVTDLSKSIVSAYGDEGAFVDQLTQAGDGSEIYSSSQDAFNDWATALFYLDTESKDMKLAQPAGIMDCPGTECPVESIFAQNSKENLERNLLSFDQQFFGGTRPDDGPGLDDLLADLGHADVAKNLSELIEEAYKKIENIEGSLKDAVKDEKQNEALEAAFDAVKAVTDLWKTQIMSLLSLSLDSDMASDTD